jgi:hypothetical protein
MAPPSAALRESSPVNRRVAGSNPACGAILLGSIPETWVTLHSGDIGNSHSGDMGNSLGPKGSSIAVWKLYATGVRVARC